MPDHEWLRDLRSWNGARGRYEVHAENSLSDEELAWTGLLSFTPLEVDVDLEYIGKKNT